MTTPQQPAAVVEILSDDDMSRAARMICGRFPRTYQSNLFYGGPVASTAQKNVLRRLLHTSSIDPETIRLVRGYFNRMRGGRITGYEVSCAIRILNGETPADQSSADGGSRTTTPTRTSPDGRSGLSSG